MKNESTKTNKAGKRYSIWKWIFWVWMALVVTSSIYLKKYDLAIWQFFFTVAWTLFIREMHDHSKTLHEHVDFLSEIIGRMDKLAKDALEAEKEAR